MTIRNMLNHVFMISVAFFMMAAGPCVEREGQEYGLKGVQGVRVESFTTLRDVDYNLYDPSILGLGAPVFKALAESRLSISGVPSSTADNDFLYVQVEAIYIGDDSAGVPLFVYKVTVEYHALVTMKTTGSVRGAVVYRRSFQDIHSLNEIKSDVSNFTDLFIQDLNKAKTL